MKNYELDIENSKRFILNYKIVNEEIIINLGTGEKYPIPYTIENEKRILEKMKRQVENCKKGVYAKKQHIKGKRNTVVASSAIMLFNIISIAYGIDIIPIMVNITSLLICASVTSYFGIKLSDAKETLDDIEKNKIFIINEMELNTNVKNNSNCLSNTTEKTKEIIAKNKEKNITVNTIDQISYEDLKKILDNIRFETELKIDHPEQQKTLVKK